MQIYVNYFFMSLYSGVHIHIGHDLCGVQCHVMFTADRQRGVVFRSRLGTFGEDLTDGKNAEFVAFGAQV
jgi:hypothetical protein